jgi:DNA-binding GntR family transcriptional regulator
MDTNAHNPNFLIEKLNKINQHINIMVKIKKIKKDNSLQSRVYEILKNYVISPDVPPGTRLYEERLAEGIGVSRTPIKTALSRLEQEGLVTINSNRGAFKVHLTWKEAIEILKIRGALERVSLEMVGVIDDKTIENLIRLIPDADSLRMPEDIVKYLELDEKFHETLVQNGISKLFFKIIKNTHDLFRMIGLIIVQDNETVGRSIEEHRRIVEALKEKDISLAITRLNENYESALKTLEERYKAFPSLLL